MLLLSLNEVKQCITMPQAINAMESAFIQLARQQVQLPQRTPVSIEKEHALMLTMPAYLEKEQALGLKVVSVFPNNLIHQKPAINGFIMLIDASSGEPQALMDAAWLTALRTGAVAGLATRYFARKNAKHVAILGSGVQAMTQLQAVACVRSIEAVTVWSRNHDNAQNFADKINKQYSVHVANSARDAVRDADIICTATSSDQPLFEYDDLQQPQVHINAVGSHTPTMREISNITLKNSLVIVDQLSAAFAEAGEIIQAVKNQFLPQENIIELGQWLLSKQSPQNSPHTVFKSVGLAIQDIAVATLVYRHAQQQKLGMPFLLKNEE